jgi:hypothetical protein
MLAFPFHVTPGGRLATVEQDTPQADAQLLEALLLTRIGERPLLPGFGIADPLYGFIDRTSIEAGVAAFGPPIDIDAITVEPSDTGHVTVTISHT